VELLLAVAGWLAGWLAGRPAGWPAGLGWIGLVVRYNNTCLLKIRSQKIIPNVYYTTCVLTEISRYITCAVEKALLNIHIINPQKSGVKPKAGKTSDDRWGKSNTAFTAFGSYVIWP
jgi:hypothetical protein